MVDLPLHVGPGVCLCLVLVGATRLVLDSLLAVVVVARVCVSVCLCLTACRRRDREDKWLYPSILPMTRHTSLLWSVAKSRLPHHMHSTHTHYPLDQWVTQLAR